MVVVVGQTDPFGRQEDYIIKKLVSEWKKTSYRSGRTIDNEKTERELLHFRRAQVI